MANEPPTGLLFRSKIHTPMMRMKLKEKMPEFDWRLGDSDLYSYYYLYGKRPDGLMVRIEPEDEPGEFYLGVYLSHMAVFPQAEEQLAIAQQIHKEVLPIVEGIRRA
jgi:hypothetical protein